MDNETLTYSLTLAYNGEPFAGFARQPGQLTVQGDLENALSTLMRRPVEVVCAGRTDAGVHARGQVVSFDVSTEELAGRTTESFLRSLNALTHDGISVRQFEERRPGFSARFDAHAREYRYFISNEPWAPVFAEAFSWHVKKPLDVDAMRAAAQLLIGEHDFKSFCLAASAEGKRTMRRVDTITVEPYDAFGEDLLCVTVIGNAFLHSMVRAIVGTLVCVGRGLRTSEWVSEVLAARSRTAAGENAPAKGLVLWHVAYD